MIHLLILFTVIGSFLIKSLPMVSGATVPFEASVVGTWEATLGGRGCGVEDEVSLVLELWDTEDAGEKPAFTVDDGNRVLYVDADGADDVVNGLSNAVVAFKPENCTSRSI